MLERRTVNKLSIKAGALHSNCSNASIINFKQLDCLNEADELSLLVRDTN
jgi:hypothetical protein